MLLFLPLRCDKLSSRFIKLRVVAFNILESLKVVPTGIGRYLAVLSWLWLYPGANDFVRTRPEKIGRHFMAHEASLPSLILDIFHTHFLMNLVSLLMLVLEFWVMVRMHLVLHLMEVQRVSWVLHIE